MKSFQITENKDPRSEKNRKEKRGWGAKEEKEEMKSRGWARGQGERSRAREQSGLRKGKHFLSNVSMSFQTLNTPCSHFYEEHCYM